MAIKESLMRRQKNIDRYLEEKLKDSDFAERFKKTGDTWDVAIQIASLRKASGMSQKELAKEVETSQQQISRLESPSYEGHSLSMLRRVVKVLGGTIHVRIQPGKQMTRSAFNRDLRKKTDLLRFELDTFDSAKPRFLNRGKKRCSVSTLSLRPERLDRARRSLRSRVIPQASDRGVEWVDFLRKEEVDLARNFRILDGLYNEALALGVIPLRKPLDGIEIDLKIAKAVNRV
jgi:transcriptional regulator with XRE-family HTH domain